MENDTWFSNRKSRVIIPFDGIVQFIHKVVDWSTQTHFDPLMTNGAKMSF